MFGCWSRAIGLGLGQEAGSGLGPGMGAGQDHLQGARGD